MSLLILFGGAVEGQSAPVSQMTPLTLQFRPVQLNVKQRDMTLNLSKRTVVLTLPKEPR